ncbi:integrase core domain-containing protein [Streptomyces fagopyri]|uniref:integrase core domain-containing protein n=1 Tax=Streptomyces fagopyri TaxID=2662397 RepID=UPI00371D8F0B
MIDHLRDGFGVEPVCRELGLSVLAFNARRRRPTASVGSVADSYGSAMAEALNGSFKAELIEHQGPWWDADEVERAVVQWVGRFNTERLPSALDHLPPEEFETQHYRSQAAMNAA